MLTAEEFFYLVEDDKGDDIENIKHLMIEFAKYHVQEALKEALGESPIYCSEGIKNCYPLENIK